jgi:glutamate dehydrogenase
MRRLVEDLLAEQGALAGAIMRHAGHPGTEASGDAEAVTAWSAAHAPIVRTARRTLDEIEKSGGDWTFAKLTIANAALRDLAGA